MARLLLALLLLLPLAAPVRAADNTMETQLRYLEKDLDRLREEVKALPEARRLDRLEAEIVGLREAIKAAEKSAEEAVKEKLEAQDKRIGDLSVTLTMQANQLSGNSLVFSAVSAFITAVLFCVTIWTAFVVPRRAEEAARIKAEELNKNAISEARTQAANVAEQAAAQWITEKAERKLQEIEARAQEQSDNHAKRFEAIISNMSGRNDPPLANRKDNPTPEKLQDPNEVVKERDAVDYILTIPPAQRTSDHWRALTKHLVDQKSYEAALSLCNEWLAQPSQTSLATAIALLRSGYCSASLTPPDWEAAITSWENLINRFGSDPDPALREEVARALVNKSIVLNNLAPPQPETAITAYDEVIQRLGSDPATAMRKRVATALVNKGVALGKLAPPRWDDAIAAYTEVVTRFGSDPDPALRERVAWALINKGGTLAELSPPRWGDAIADYDEVIQRFGSDPTPALRERVARALVNKGNALVELAPPKWEDAIAAYTEVITRFDGDSAPALREQVAWALANKNAVLGKFAPPTPADP